MGDSREHWISTDTEGCQTGLAPKVQTAEVWVSLDKPQAPPSKAPCPK